MLAVGTPGERPAADTVEEPLLDKLEAGFPDTHCAVEARRGKTNPIGMEPRGQAARGGAAQHWQRPPGGHIPEMDRAVLPGRGEPITVGGKGDRVKRERRLDEHVDLFTRASVPQPDRAV